jgi:Domain of unknown function (DUF5659)
VSTGRVNIGKASGETTFETRDFYLACFLRCTGYDLIDLRAEGRRKVFVFRDRATRQGDVLAFYGDATSVVIRHPVFTTPVICKMERKIR